MKLPADRVAKLRAFYDGKRVLVTGGAGFIGGHLVDALMAVGAIVTVIDDLSASSLDHLAPLIELDPERISFVHASILDDDALRAAGRGAQVVFHLAAIGSVPRSIEQPQRSWSVNATGTVRVLEMARAVGAGRVLFAASSSAYGDGPELPRVETQLPRALSPYAASKLAAEFACTAWSQSYGLSTLGLRFFNVFGPRQPGDSAYAAVVPAFTKALLNNEPPVIFGDGSSTRDFTFVSSAVLAMLLAGASQNRLMGQVVNIGAGRRTSIYELSKLLAQRCGVPHILPRFAPARAGDVKDSHADTKLARSLIGFEPLGTLEEGLAETVEWSRRVLAGKDA